MSQAFTDFVQPQIVLSITDTGGDKLKLGYRRPWMEQHKYIDLPEVVNIGRVSETLTALRAQLSSHSTRYEQFLTPENKDKISCDAEKIKQLWLALAEWGSAAYVWLFDPDGLQDDKNLLDLSEQLKKLTQGSRILIDALRMPLPWGLFYDGELPSLTDPNFFESLFSHFWGIKYRLEVRPPYGPNSYINQPPVLGNTEQTGLMFAINQQSDEDYHTGQMEFVNKLDTQFRDMIDHGEITLMLNTSKEKVLASLATRTEPQHLYYFFCHHEKGEGKLEELGFQNHEPTKIILQGIGDGVITLNELLRERIKPFRFPPVVFLNACQSGQHETGDPTSFMTFFILNMHSWNYIGTVADVPAAFADNYGREFVERFLQAAQVGEITYELNRKFAFEHLNPFGLYYTLFGLGQIRLEKGIKQTNS